MHLPWVYVHSSICETYLVQWYYIDLWSIGGGEPWYMCILLYVKLTSCCAIPQIYGQLGGTSALGICAFFYMWNLFGVVAFHRSMVNWRRGPWYICILLYVKLIWCSGIPYIYVQLGGEYICPGYMCILLYVKLIWCSGIPQIYGLLEGATSALGICAFFYM